MSCTATDNNFFNVNSFTYVAEICEGEGYLLLSIVVNMVLALFVIYFGEQRFRYQRLVQFIEDKYTDKTKKILRIKLFPVTDKVGGCDSNLKSDL